MAERIALLGDSILDNAAYTSGQPDVVAHLRGMLPAGCKAMLLAVDGSVITDVHRQVAQIPADVTRVVVSVGGNDALQNIDMLDRPVRSTRDALHVFHSRAARFELDYRSAVAAVQRRVPDVTVCTIYNGNLPPDFAPAARVALMMFNDAILRVAFESRLPVIDLRLICTEPADYANPIEPSGPGGAKIARAIVTALGLAPGGAPMSRVYGG